MTDSTPKLTKNQRRKQKQNKKRKQLKADGKYVKAHKKPKTDSSDVKPGLLEPKLPVKRNPYANTRYGGRIEKFLNQRKTASDLVLFFETIVAIAEELSKSHNVFGETTVVATKTAIFDTLIPAITSNSVTSDVLGSLMSIKEHLVNMDYNKANQVYINMTVGTATWHTDGTGGKVIKHGDYRHVFPFIKRLMTFWENYIGARVTTVDERLERLPPPVPKKKSEKKKLIKEFVAPET
eukprot:CAMPEP_0168538094 /NCGR_PEP_ID=MMETSP0405-20121227/20851_1 /TAXON_ID=498012 /ORGANISM="Trichosphaerium sp, Strain Am-I-7 wt" /LENGTH=236 /DNA_ID=CAMNT_0008567047 /DNA_START=42 /DNA_END=748 /DNA_ORIENTATION=-